MSDKNKYQDYYKYSWTVPKPIFSNNRFFLTRLTYIIPLGVASYFAAKKISELQNIVINTQLHSLLFILMTILILVIMVIDYVISKAKVRGVDIYTISENGFSINNRNTPLSKIINNSNINPEKLTSKSSIFQIKMNNNFLSKSIKFNTKSEADKFFESLTKYSS